MQSRVDEWSLFDFNVKKTKIPTPHNEAKERKRNREVMTATKRPKLWNFRLWYHWFAQFLLLSFAVTLTGYGIYLSITLPGGPLDLKYTANSVLSRILRLDFLLVATGILFLLTFALAFTIERRKEDKCYLASYIVVTLLISIVLTSLAGFSWYLKRHDRSLKTFFRLAWARTVRLTPQSICRGEEALKCRSFIDLQCQIEKCANCAGLPSTRTCFSVIQGFFRRFYLSFAIVLILTAGIILLDMYVACSL